MNKYLKTIKENDNFFINFFNEFDNLLKEKKQTKGLKYKDLMVELYTDLLFKDKDEYRIIKKNYGSGFEITRSSNHEYNKNGLFVDRFFINIDQKSNKANLETIMLKKRIEKNLYIDYFFGVDSDKDINVSITLHCGIGNYESMLCIKRNEISIQSNNEGKKSISYEKNKELLYKLSSLAKINTDLIVDYLLLGKVIGNEQFDMFSLENDIFIDNEKNIFKIDLEKVSDVVSNNKLNIK